MKTDKTIVTYEPDNSIKKGYISLIGEIFSEIKNNHWLTYQLFKRDFVSMYKQAFMGIIWAFIMPFIMIGTFLILHRSNIFSLGNIKIPYPLFAILGMSFWQLFSTGLIAGSNALIKAGNMIVKINFSKKSLIIASFAQAIVSFLVQFLLFIILLFIYHYKPSYYILLFPLLIVPIVLFTLSFSFVFSLLNGVFRDIGNILSLLITFLMFLTPILYAKPTVGILNKITYYNPLYFLVAAPRDLILFGKIDNLNGFIFWSLISLFFFFLSLIIFHLTETRIAERI